MFPSWNALSEVYGQQRTKLEMDLKNMSIAIFREFCLIVLPMVSVVKVEVSGIICNCL